MAGLVFLAGIETAEYRGLDATFEYVNEDGALGLRSCGQAAAATLLAACGAWQAGTMAAMLRTPPDRGGIHSAYYVGDSM